MKYHVFAHETLNYRSLTWHGTHRLMLCGNNITYRTYPKGVFDLPRGDRPEKKYLVVAVGVDLRVTYGDTRIPSLGLHAKPAACLWKCLFSLDS